MTKNRLDWVDAAKGISIYLVVLTHAHYWLRASGIETTSPFGINDALAEMRLPLFFFAAGLFAVKYMSGSWESLISRKVVLLFWVFLIWQIIGVGYSIAAGVFIHSSPVGEVTLRAFIKPLVSVIRPSNELWFLWALCLMFVLTKILWRLSIFWRLAITAIPSIIICAIPPESDSGSQEILGIGWMGLFQYLFVFILGAVVDKVGAHAIGRIKPFIAFLGTIFFGFIIMMSLHVNLGVGNVLFMISGLAFGISLALCVQRVNAITSLGKQTLSVYVMHTTLLVLACIPVAQYVHTGAAFRWEGWLPIVLSVSATALCYWTHRSWGLGILRYLFSPPPRLLRFLATRRRRALEL